MAESKRARRKLISFSNYSICVTLPKKSLEQLGWHKGTEVMIDVNLGSRSMTLFKRPTTSDRPQPELPEATPVVKPYHQLVEEHPARPVDVTSEQLRW